MCSRAPPKGRGKGRAIFPASDNQAEKLRHKTTPRQCGAVPLKEVKGQETSQGEEGNALRAPPRRCSLAETAAFSRSQASKIKKQHPGVLQPRRMPACPGLERGTLPSAPKWRTPRPSPPQSPSRPPPAAAAVTSAPRPKLTQSSGPGPGWGEAGPPLGGGSLRAAEPSAPAPAPGMGWTGPPGGAPSAER